jgi:sugar lactone lactonase YvrE
MKVDVEGHVYCTGPGGIWIMTPAGKHLGTILTGAQTTTSPGEEAIGGPSVSPLATPWGVFS